jgi:hypothetical protein
MTWLLQDQPVMFPRGCQQLNMPVGGMQAAGHRTLIRYAPGAIRDRQPTQIHAKEQV